MWGGGPVALALDGNRTRVQGKDLDTNEQALKVPVSVGADGERGEFLWPELRGVAGRRDE